MLAKLPAVVVLDAVVLGDRGPTISANSSPRLGRCRPVATRIRICAARNAGRFERVEDRRQEQRDWAPAG